MIQVRRHGTSGREVVVVHGGPAAAGSMGPLARALADGFRVLEPWQRGSGAEPLTVARHVADLHEVVETCCPGERPALVGHSWGAMLVLAYGAEHPDAARSLALIGCGTFDLESRARLQQTLEERTTEELRQRVAEMEARVAEPAERLVRTHELMRSREAVEPLPMPPEPDLPPFDGRAHEETWQDMLRCQADGLYPAAFAAITSPLLMLHGDHDPHPGAMIRDGLRRHIPHLQYHELARCGHEPWTERWARDEFYRALREWLSR
jgi:pimeloyl-ACP methyl ester carboxylesterase